MENFDEHQENYQINNSYSPNFATNNPDFLNFLREKDRGPSYERKYHSHLPKRANGKR